jgi:hypothetical protein
MESGDGFERLLLILVVVDVQLQHDLLHARLISAVKGYEFAENTAASKQEFHPPIEVIDDFNTFPAAMAEPTGAC